MDKEQLFKYLRGRRKSALLKLIEDAFDELTTYQKYSVFGDSVKRAKPAKVIGSQLLEEVRRFRADSLARVYYAPFDINSKNFSHIPEETTEWFETLNDLLLGSTRLSQSGDHITAVDCFSILYELIGKMEYCEEIVFADEYGSWMIPGDEQVYIEAYISSLAATKTCDEYARLAADLIRRDSRQSHTAKAHSTAIRLANKEQREALKAEVKRREINPSQNTK